jgi:hypothetical protein
VANKRLPFGILDTSVVIDIGVIAIDALPLQSTISALTLAELSAGLPAAPDHATRAIRQRRLQNIEALIEVLPFDTSCARAYASIFAAVHAKGRAPRGSRAVDYMIAATALQHRLPLYTRNPKDFEGLTELIRVVTV